jgi:hypothetical protein
VYAIVTVNKWRSVSSRDEASERLRVEYDAGRETFLTGLRIDLVWDDEAFARLTDALRDGCVAFQNEETVPRWVAKLYWFAPTFVRTWTSHEAWKNTLAFNPAYYESCYGLLEDLAWRFFSEGPLCPERSETQ